MYKLANGNPYYPFADTLKNVLQLLAFLRKTLPTFSCQERKKRVEFWRMSKYTLLLTCRSGKIH